MFPIDGLIFRVNSVSKIERFEYVDLKQFIKILTTLAKHQICMPPLSTQISCVAKLVVPPLVIYRLPRKVIIINTLLIFANEPETSKLHMSLAFHKFPQQQRLICLIYL